MTQPDPWESLLRRFKEKLAERLWALPSVSETEKEIVFREYLADLDALETELGRMHQDTAARTRSSLEENDLLRSLMGVPGDELKTRALTMAEDINATKEQLARRDEELAELRERLSLANDQNDALRRRIQEFESQSDVFRARQQQLREDDIRHFSEANESIREEVKDLETRLGNLRQLFTESNKALVAAKQEEISLLQKKLLEEMSSTLKRRQEVAWAEEEAFAKGVAQRVRTALVSAQGQLLLTLERLGLMDPESGTEDFWKARVRLFIDGAAELSRNFREIQALLQDVTAALDDYLHLTHRRALGHEPIALADVVRSEMASLYADRQPTLHFEVLSDDPMPDIHGDPQLVSFIARELIKNAVEALPNGAGRVVVALKHQPQRNVVQVLFRDSGRGIPENVRDRVFQPFFTTKEHRQGLSLSRARRYAEFHNGTLELLESGDGGTLFRLELPIGDAGPSEVPATSPRRPDPRSA